MAASPALIVWVVASPALAFWVVVVKLMVFVLGRGQMVRAAGGGGGGDMTAARCRRMGL